MIKDAAKTMEPANLDTQTKAIVVFALHNGRHMIATKVPHNPTPTFFFNYYYFYSTANVLVTTVINHLLSFCTIHISFKFYFNNFKIPPRRLL